MSAFAYINTCRNSEHGNRHRPTVTEQRCCAAAADSHRQLSCRLSPPPRFCPLSPPAYSCRCRPLAAEFGSTVSPTRCTRASCLWPTRPAPRCIARLQVHSVWCAAPDEFGGRAPCVRARVLIPPSSSRPLLAMLFSLRTHLRSLSPASSAPAHGRSSTRSAARTAALRVVDPLPRVRRQINAVARRASAGRVVESTTTSPTSSTSHLALMICDY